MQKVDLIIFVSGFGVLFLLSVLLNFFHLFMVLLLVGVLGFVFYEEKIDIFRKNRLNTEGHRFAVSKGKHVKLVNYNVTVKYNKLIKPKTELHSFTSAILNISVIKGERKKLLTFDISNKYATRTQKAFGLSFNFHDHRNGRAIMSVN